MAENNNRGVEGSGAFMLGLLTGTVLGAGIGMLMAPKAGAELRGQLGEQARSLGASASEQYQKAADSAATLAEKGRELVAQARVAASKSAEELRGYGGTANGAQG